MSELTEFLLARIAEDEAAANAEDLDFEDTMLLPTYDSGHQARWHTDRVRAECEAKRRIVGHAILLEEQAAEMPHDAANKISFEGQALAWRVALRELALPYADHPDYREEWRP